MNYTMLPLLLRSYWLVMLSCYALRLTFVFGRFLPRDAL